MSLFRAFATGAAAMLLTIAPAVTAAATESGPSGTISGTIIGEDGTIVPIGVRLYRDGENGIAAGANNSQSTGAYEVADITPGTYRVAFVNNGSGDANQDRFLSEWWQDAYARADSMPITIAPGQNLQLDVQLRRPITISGTFSTPIGPVVNTHLSLRGTSGDFFGFGSKSLGGYTDANGAFTFWVSPDSYTLEASGRAGWETVNQLSERYDPAHPGSPITVDFGDDTVLTLTTRRTSAIEGRVLVDVDGSLEPSANGVWAYPLDGQTSYTPFLTPERDGRFAFLDLAPGRYKIKFSGNGLALSEYWESATESEAAIVTVSENEVVTGIDAVLEQGAKVHATVTAPSLSSTQSGYVRAAVDVYRLDEATGGYSRVTTASSTLGSRLETEALTAGTYALYFYAVDRYDVGATYWQDAKYFFDRTDVTVASGQVLDLESIELPERVFEVDRLAGADRYATSVAASRAALPEGNAPVVYIANGTNYPDALAAGPAASAAGGVVLLVPPDSIPPVVADELERLEPMQIVIAGGSSAVSNRVQEQLSNFVDSSTDVIRVGGADRFETAELLVRRGFESSGADAVFIATGRNFPDALAAGPAAAQFRAPVVLVDSWSNTADPDVIALIKDLGADDLYFVGGPVALSASLERSITAGLTGQIAGTTRFEGDDRYAVAAKINAFAFDNPDHAFLSTGFDFADALSGGPLAAMYGAPIYLATPGCVPLPTATGLLTERVVGVHLIGGLAALSSAVEQLTLCS
ncbi:hypothetical protein ESP57_05260 [Agromyces fucosus]|uniref:Alpha-amylase n=1 Tax=Agromyces fucosus TaxID=41985 RepID=A0A4Q2JV05_9MICO|nr:hypothetical protein ESP57_05260 [Agromyces fucosus]